MSKHLFLNNVRLRYEHVFTPSAFDDSQDAKYSVTVILPKDHPDLPVAKRAMMEAGQEAFPNDFKGTAWPKGYTCSLRDADVAVDSAGVVLAEKDPNLKGCYVLDANSSKRPLTIDRGRHGVTEDDGLIYAGSYVNVSLAASDYTFGKVKKGVKCYLNGVQFVAHGERFGVNVIDDFDALDGEDDGFLD